MQCLQRCYKPAPQLDSKGVTKPLLERLTMKFAYHHLPTKAETVFLGNTHAKHASHKEPKLTVYATRLTLILFSHSFFIAIFIATSQHTSTKPLENPIAIRVYRLSRHLLIFRFAMKTMKLSLGEFQCVFDFLSHSYS